MPRASSKYRADYSAYYEACRDADSPPIRDPNPTVILIPGLGMIAFGKNKSESRVTAEFYSCAVAVMRGAEAVGEYVALPPQEAFDIEYWALEEAKLRRMPPEKTLARKVVLVVGAGSGIGVETAKRVAAEGAHVVCADRNLDGASATAEALTAKYGQGIGVAGSGISRCGPAIALSVDITDAESVRSHAGAARSSLTAGSTTSSSPPASSSRPTPRDGIPQSNGAPALMSMSAAAMSSPTAPVRSGQRKLCRPAWF